MLQIITPILYNNTSKTFWIKNLLQRTSEHNHIYIYNYDIYIYTCISNYERNYIKKTDVSRKSKICHDYIDTYIYITCLFLIILFCVSA